MKNHMTRFLSRVLVLLMMLQLVSVGPVFATSASAENDEAEQEEILSNDAEDDVEEAAPAEEPAEEEPVEEAPVENEEPVEEPVFDTQASTDEIVLKDGAASFPDDCTLEQANAILSRVLIENYDSENDYSSLSWEYYCEGKASLSGKTNMAWGSIEGFKIQSGITRYTHPALWDNADGTYSVRLAGTTETVNFTKIAKQNSGITLVENPTLKLFYNDDGSVNYDEVRAMVLEQIASTTPEGLTADDLHVTYYAASSLTGLKHDWVDFEGSSRYPAMSSGEQRIKISYDGNESYYGTEVEFTVNVEVGRDDSRLEFCENPTIKLVYNDDLSIDYSAAYQAIFNLLETKVPEDITLDDLTIEYYASVLASHEWMPLEGGKGSGVNIALTFPEISEGTQTIRVSYAGDKTHNPTSVTAEVTVLGRPEVNVAQKEGPYNVGFVFADAENYDYDATARAIYDAVVASNDQGLGYEDFTIEYNASKAGSALPVFMPLDCNDIRYNKLTDGTWTIRFSWNGTAAYKDGYFDVEVTVTDSREASAVVLKDGAEITYNMDASVMEQAIFDNAIDWDNSALPEDASLSDFTIEYYASSVSETGAFDGAFKNWAPVGGGTVLLVKYPQMGAADAQQIRITYNGSAEFRPSETVEGTLKVNKADVKVKVHSAIIRANEEVPANFVTIDPNDPKIDIYTVYAGISSSNVENDVSKLGGCIYLDLPDRFNDSSFMKMADAACKIACGKTLTEIMQEGTTVGALKKALKTQEILDLLKKLNIDTGAVGQLIEVLNKLPGVFDNTRVAFGTPNHAGVYTATAITDNANYNTGVGVGVLTVLKVTKGVKITWDEDIPKKLTQEEAETFNWDAYLTVDGVAVKDTSNIHYLYSGFTSKWKPYSSTTAPTEPGRYVVTVVTINGDYLAAPVTRTFQITK